MKALMPKHYQLLKEIANRIGHEDYSAVLNECYAKLESISVDYGILEHAKNIYVLPGSFGWDDVGSWNSIERLNAVDENGNVLRGEVKAIQTRNCTVDANGRLVAMIGVENMVVVDTKDALLICHKDHTNDINQILDELKLNKDHRL
jgi:mannose-1-phosphate guanylyltransferase